MDKKILKNGFPADDFICDDAELYEEYKKVWHSFFSNSWSPTREKIFLTESEKKLSLDVFKSLFSELSLFILRGCSKGKDEFKDFVYIASHEHKDVMRTWLYNTSTLITVLRSLNEDKYYYDEEVRGFSEKIVDLDSLFIHKSELINKLEIDNESKITIDI